MEVIRDQKGMTLIETIVALVLVLILVTAFAGAFVIGLQSEAEVDMWLMAGDTAESIMEFLSEVDIDYYEDDNYDGTYDVGDYDGLIGFNYFFNEEEYDFDVDDEVGDFQNFIIEEDSYIKFIDVENQDGLVQVEIMVNWKDGDGEWDFDLVSRLRK